MLVLEMISLGTKGGLDQFGHARIDRLHGAIGCGKRNLAEAGRFCGPFSNSCLQKIALNLAGVDRIGTKGGFRGLNTGNGEFLSESEIIGVDFFGGLEKAFSSVSYGAKILAAMFGGLLELFVAGDNAVL